MALTTFPIPTLVVDENEFPKVILLEVAAASVPTPAAGDQIIFIDSTTHHICRKDSGAAVVDIESASGDVVGPASAVDSRIACFDGTTGKLLKDGGSTIASIVAGAISSSIYVLLQEQQTQNTNSSGFTSGAWRTRPLNTEVSDVGGLCSLSSNQFTLAAGTYVIRAVAPAYYVNRHQTRLQNVTDGSTVLVGQGAYAFRDVGGDSGMTLSVLTGIFTIAASKALELQHQCQTSNATNGMGLACNFTTEVYAIVELWKVG